MKKIFFAAMALALVGCSYDKKIGHGDIYIAGHPGKVCTGILELTGTPMPFYHQLVFLVTCDNGVKIADVKNVSFRSDSSTVDASKFEEVFGK